MIKETSNVWAILVTNELGLVILDPDGWDRKNYEYSWYKEEITRDEFMERLNKSTTITISY